MDYKTSNTLLLPSVLDEKILEFCNGQTTVRVPSSELWLTYWIFPNEKLKNLVKLKFDDYSK
jgi:hypothetical protein